MLLRLFRPLIVVVVVAGTASAQAPPPDIAGVWVLNPALTERPQEIGFSPDWAPPPADERGGRGGGRERRSGGTGFPQAVRESADDSTRKQQLTGEARTPPSHLTIVQRPDAVSIADDQGHSRTFHPTARLDDLTIGTVALPTTASWDAGSLVVVYDVESGRQLRYTYTPSANPARLLVDIRFLERGRDGDEVKLTYERPDEHEREAISGGAAPAAVPAPRASAAPAGAAPTAPGPPAAARPPMLPPGSELRGLTVVGTQVEDLSPQAAVCGLDQSKIKTAVARILADAGFKTQPLGNEESYVLISVVTSRLSDGVCVSRYDASLMANGDATFPYLKGTVMVEVPLLRQGGMTGGSPAQHAAGVMDALTKAVSSFVSQIRAAGK
jgi:hypothetical protein